MKYVKAHVTETGIAVLPLMPEADDMEVVVEPCVYCRGNILGSDARGMDGRCDACRETPGSSGRAVTKRTLRQKAWEDMVWMIDAQRREKMAGANNHGGYCPDCGVYDCGNGGEYDCPKAPKLDYLVDAMTGEEVAIIQVP